MKILRSVWIPAVLSVLVILWTFGSKAYGVSGQPEKSAGSALAKPELVVIDTDIGDDIDDAFALGLALKSPELKVLGVTTAFGNTELRAQLAERYLEAAGRGEIPVAAGIHTETTNPMTQAAYARRGPEKAYPDGVTFLLDQIRAHPGEVTLIAIGPLFNVQAAIQRDPATFRKLKRVVMMGGSIARGYDDPKTGAHRPPDAEWNILQDPKGAQALLTSGVPVFMMPLDSTQVHLEEPERDAIFAHGSPVTDQITLLYHQWKMDNWSHSPTPTLFDPVAVTYSFRPELCPATPMHIEVDDKGFTRRTDGKVNAEVCMMSDEAGFLAVLGKRLAGRSTGTKLAPGQ